MPRIYSGHTLYQKKKNFFDRRPNNNSTNSVRSKDTAGNWTATTVSTSPYSRHNAASSRAYTDDMSSSIRSYDPKMTLTSSLRSYDIKAELVQLIQDARDESSVVGDGDDGWGYYVDI